MSEVFQIGVVIHLLHIRMSHSFMVQRAQREMQKRHSELSFGYKPAPDSLRVLHLPMPEMMFGKTMEMLLTPSASRQLAFTPVSGNICQQSLSFMQAICRSLLQDCIQIPSIFCISFKTANSNALVVCLLSILLELIMRIISLACKSKALMVFPRWAMCKSSICHAFVPFCWQASISYLKSVPTQEINIHEKQKHNRHYTFECFCVSACWWSGLQKGFATYTCCSKVNLSIYLLSVQVMAKDTVMYAVVQEQAYALTMQ